MNFDYRQQKKKYEPFILHKSFVFVGWGSVEHINFVLVINLFLANVSIWYRLKAPENLAFSDVFMGYKMETLVRNKLMINPSRPVHFRKLY